MKRIKAWAVVLKNYPEHLLVSYCTEHIDMFLTKQLAREHIQVIDSEGCDEKDYKIVPCEITIKEVKK
jgi:hypothetical protein